MDALARSAHVNTLERPDQLLDEFRKQHPELADILERAAEARAYTEAYVRSLEPVVTYTSSAGTRTI